MRTAFKSSSYFVYNGFTKSGLQLIKFNRCTIELGSLFKRAFRLQEVDVLFVKNLKDQVAAIYRGIVLKSGSKKEVANFIEIFFKKLRSRARKQITEALEKLRSEKLKHEGGSTPNLKSIIATDDAGKVQAFKALEAKFINETTPIVIKKPFEKLSEVLALLNHKSVGNAVVQIGFENCADVSDAIINFLKTGIIRRARPSSFETFEKVSAKYGGGHFQQLHPGTLNGVFYTPMERLQALIKNDDIVVIYGVDYVNSITKSTEGHYFIGVKKDGILHLFDGQTGEYLEFVTPKSLEYEHFIRSKYNKRYKTIEGGGFKYLLVR